MPRPKGIETAKTNCRHCGRELSTIRIWTHERVCIHNPTVRAAVITTMAAENDGEGVTMSQYAARSAGDLTIPDVTTLRRATGAHDWAGVLAEFGLVPQTVQVVTASTTTPVERLTRSQRKEAAVLAAVDEMSEAARRIVAAEYDSAHTFDGYRVRDLPGVYVNGRECVAVMLR